MEGGDEGACLFPSISLGMYHVAIESSGRNVILETA